MKECQKKFKRCQKLKDTIVASKIINAVFREEFIKMFNKCLGEHLIILVPLKALDKYLLLIELLAI